MCELENKVFDEHPAAKPTLYVRYVDDICLYVSNYHELQEVKALFGNNSVLNFTYEIEVNKKIPFLDVLLERSNGALRTSVYVKPTNYGDCLNYRSMCPDRYKTGVIPYHVSTDWNVFCEELERIKQILTNNNYPMALIEDVIKKIVTGKLTQRQNNTNEIGNEVKLFFCNQMSSDFKLTENRLKKIVNNNVKVANDNDQLKLLIYYRGKKLRSLFIRNKQTSQAMDVANRHHVVYQYTCNRDGCNTTNTTYIGYTACSIWERFKMHTQAGSIKRHLLEKHDIVRVARRELVDDVTILRSCTNKRDLIYCEAILIKENRPPLNAQNEGCERILKIFNH